MFGKSWNLGTVSGIKIRVHWTFLILLAWIWFSSITSGNGFASALFSLLFVVAIFGCVLLHELGHALTARRFGIGTRDITLLPIGGVAALERIPRNPIQEFWIAVAGPLVNVAIAILLFTGLYLLPIATLPIALTFLLQLAIANVVLVAFNMLPAFPMDGGRVLRAILAMFVDYVRATNLAATVGQFVSIGLGLLGIATGNLMLVFVAIFVYMAARAERYQVEAEQIHSRFGASSRATPNFETPNFQLDESEATAATDDAVPASLSVGSVAVWLANQHREVCAVVDHGRIIGLITRNQLIKAIYRGMAQMPVGRLMTSQSAM
ncbi:MAG: site-2 protease family protein [Pirellulaceae bacterium]